MAALSHIYVSCKFFWILFGFLKGISTAEVKENPSHTPFGDFNDELKSIHKTFSFEELSKYDGQNGEFSMYTALKGVVFDVSGAKDRYGPGKPYHVFLGKDASRAIAKWSLDTSNLNGNIDNLSEVEFSRLEETFQNIYMKKYPVVGYIKGHEPTHTDDMSHTWRKEDL